MLRWYCWLIFFAIAILSTWTFPADEAVDESNLVVVENEYEKNEDVADARAILSGEDEEDEDDDDDDDDEGIVEDGTLAITDRYLSKKKPQKYKNDKDDSPSSKGKNKNGKKPYKKKCFYFGKKPKGYYPQKPPQKPGKPGPPSSSPPKPNGSSSEGPNGQGNQGGSSTKKPNNNNGQRPGPQNGF